MFVIFIFNNDGIVLSSTNKTHIIRIAFEQDIHFEDITIKGTLVEVVCFVA